jgi:hypothetical protein
MMARPLKKIADELQEAWRKYERLDFGKFFRGAIETDGYQKLARAARKGSPQDRRNLATLQREMCALPMANFLKLSAELKAAVDEIADQPLPMGTSSVSKQPLSGPLSGPLNGAMHAVLSEVKVRSALDLALEIEGRENFTKLGD